MDQSAQLAVRLVQLMQARQTSIRQLSTVINKPRSTINDWRKTGKVTPDAIVPICRCLNASLLWFLTGQGHIDQSFNDLESSLRQEECHLIDVLRSQSQLTRHALKATVQALEQAM